MGLNVKEALLLLVSLLYMVIDDHYCRLVMQTKEYIAMIV